MVSPSSAGASARDQVVLEVKHLTYCYGGGATWATRNVSEPKLLDVNCTFGRGSRILVTGANGAGKSTLLSIMGGKRMVERDQCLIFGREVFHDTSLSQVRMYCGDWWRTDFFFNITVAELIGESRLATERVQRLIDIMQINVSWRINAISDGQRRRCQLLECLAEEKSVYILDEITTDLDLYAREGLLRFLRAESEERGATVFYATHIFDHLAEWATDLLHFSSAKVARCCSMKDLTEYHDLIARGTRCPLYALMREWVFREYDAPVGIADHSELGPSVTAPQQQDSGAPVPVLETKQLSYAYSGGAPQLADVSFSFGRGARILVVGANGAGKSTLLSVLGGKRMIPRGFAAIMGKDCFNDTSVTQDVMYCGDWWRTSLFCNLQVHEVLGEVSKSARCRHLVDVLQVNLEWKINEISDGQRRRCQLLEILSTPRSVYLMDEITSDLDLFAREGILSFLRAESEHRGATVFYCTHIFDELEGWATHVLHLSKGSVVRSCEIDSVEEYNRLIKEGNATPLYSLVRSWVYAEYAAAGDSRPWRKLDESLDGRVPNLGLAGPFQLTSA